MAFLLASCTHCQPLGNGFSMFGFVNCISHISRFLEQAGARLNIPTIANTSYLMRKKKTASNVQTASCGSGSCISSASRSASASCDSKSTLSLSFFAGDGRSYDLAGALGPVSARALGPTSRGSTLSQTSTTFPSLSLSFFEVRRQPFDCPGAQPPTHIRRTLSLSLSLSHLISFESPPPWHHQHPPSTWLEEHAFAWHPCHRI